MMAIIEIIAMQHDERGGSAMKYEESPVLELKEQINVDFKKEIIAFANTDGG